ncbi:2-phospho-L-lactate transferase [Acidobacteria bacterium AH-259-A15]|nr:2-phospho-L-lactate transferase [Acidobacteria bacterium AH-259-A15]
MIVALAGGIGAAKLLLGFSKLLPPNQLTVIGNTGDDIELFGLRICPDLDTITYTLSEKINPETGWGLQDDSFECVRALQGLGAPSWFRLGDRDLATHLWRTSLLQQGHSLTQVTARICEAFGTPCTLLPMTDSYTPTYLVTDQGELHLQEYLVREKCRPLLRALKYLNIKEAQPAPGVADAIAKAEGVFLCPSNPFISIGPILAIPGVRELLIQTEAPVFAVTPIVGRRALKGPAAKMLAELGYPLSPTAVAGLYKDFLNVFVLDEQDRQLRAEIEGLGVKVVTTNTIMSSIGDKIDLARELLELL